MLVLAGDCDTLLPKFVYMQIELGKGGLGFHHHDSPLTAFHQLNLSLLLSVVFLLFQLHLVVAHEFFFSVTHLQVQLEL